MLIPEAATARANARPDPDWDYDILAELTEGLRRAITKKGTKTHRALFSAFQSRQRRLTEPIMQIVEFEGFDCVRDALNRLALRQPQWFPDGIKDVQAVANARFFAALDHGTLYISTAEWPEIAFAPARELVDAVADIKAGRPLSFKQEYAVEVLQHELVHNAYPRATLARKAIDIEDFEECLVQLVARQRYPDLLRLLGAEARYAQAVLNGGYAYHRGTRNLVEIAQQAGISVVQLEQTLREHDARQALKQLIAKALGVSEKQAGGLLNQAMIKPLDDFRAKISQLRAYVRPPGKG